MRNIVISEQLFIDIVELLEKVACNIFMLYNAKPSSFIKLPLMKPRKCTAVFMQQLATECSEMTMLMFDETADQWQYKINTNEAPEPLGD